MGLRTTDSAVRAIIDVDEDLALTPFIETANTLIDWLDGEDSAGVLTSDMLERIERWLSAHFVAHRDQLFADKKTGDASAKFQVKVDLGLASTQYGQTAMILDVTGTLAKLNDQGINGIKTATALWGGTAWDNQDHTNGYS